MLFKDVSLPASSSTAVPRSLLPCCHHSHKTLVEVSETPANPAADATIELRIHQRYVLFVEPIKGKVVATDGVDSGELCLQFKIPLFYLCSNGLPLFSKYVSEKLVELPISLDLCGYLKPLIQSSVAVEAIKTRFKKELKVVFVVKSVKNDFVDKQECDKIGCSLRMAITWRDYV